MSIRAAGRRHRRGNVDAFVGQQGGNGFDVGLDARLSTLSWTAPGIGRTVEGVAATNGHGDRRLRLVPGAGRVDVVRHEHHPRAEERRERVVDGAEERVDGSIAARVGAPSVATADEGQVRAARSLAAAGGGPLDGKRGLGIGKLGGERFIVDGLLQESA